MLTVNHDSLDRLEAIFVRWWHTAVKEEARMVSEKDYHSAERYQHLGEAYCSCASKVAEMKREIAAENGEVQHATAHNQKTMRLVFTDIRVDLTLQVIEDRIHAALGWPVGSFDAVLCTFSDGIQRICVDFPGDMDEYEANDAIEKFIDKINTI